MRKAAFIASIACGTLVVAVGITCLVLGVKGYFTFEEPCVGMQSFVIKDVDLTYAEGGNAFLDVLDSLTGGMASSLVPTQASITLDIVLEVNNTNPYDLDYEQGEEGLVAIRTTSTDEGDSDQEEDLIVGTWEVPSSTLKSNARNEIPVSLNTSIDLMDTDTMGLAGGLVSGSPLVFRITGGIEGSSWVPGMSGKSIFICLANVDNILELGSGTNIKCKHSTKVGKGRIINENGEIEFQGLDEFEDDEVDPACFV